MIERFLFYGIHRYRGDLTVNGGIETAISVYSNLTYTCIVFRDDAVVRAEMAPHLPVNSLFIEECIFFHGRPP